MSFYLGFDTSNYTTSAALYDASEDRMYHARKLLAVEQGSLGLRQRDALFLHTVQLSDLVESFSDVLRGSAIAAVGASERPRQVEGSYMPCFLAGKSHAKTIAALYGMPYFAFSHQQGHLAAGAWSVGRVDLLRREFLALHVSGGTTELLHVTPSEEQIMIASRIGGSTDLAAGQLIDRCGTLLGLGFPAGPQLEQLALNHTSDQCFVPRSHGMEFSLSGLENKVKDLQNSQESASNIAHFVIKSITEVLCLAIERARKAYPELPILAAGGVMSNAYIRSEIERRCHAIFAKPEYSSDNAAGIAYLTALSHIKGGDAVAAR